MDCNDKAQTDTFEQSSEGGRRTFLKAAGASGVAGLAGLTGCLGGGAGGSTPTIKMLAWTSYSEEQELIEEALDVELDVTKSSSSAKMFSAWNSGQAENYDICVPNNNYVSKFIDADLAAPVPRDDMQYYPEMYGKFQTFAKNQFGADGNVYGVPIRFGWYGYSYDSRDISVDKEDSYAVLFDEGYTDSEMKGKVMMYDNHFKSISAAALYLGYRDAFDGDRITLSDKQLDEAKQLLIDQKPMVEGYTSADATFIKSYKQDNASAALTGRYLPTEMKLDGDGWATMAQPKEGEMAWFEGAVVSKASDNKEMAWKVVDQYLSPEVGAQFSKKAGIPSTNPAAADNLSGQAAELLTIEPSRLEGMLPFKLMEDEDKWVSAWEQVKAA